MQLLTIFFAVVGAFSVLSLYNNKKQTSSPNCQVLNRIKRGICHSLYYCKILNDHCISHNHVRRM